MKTIKELELTIGLSRRQIQEYEKFGLSIKPTEKDMHGSLLYDEKAISRLILLRLYCEERRSIDWMKKRISDPSFNQRNEIMAHVQLLEKRVEEYQDFITVAKHLNSMNLSPDKLYITIPGMEELSFDDMLTIFGSIFGRLQLSDTEKIEGIVSEDDLVNFLNDEILDKLFEKIEKIMALRQENIQAKSASIQQILHELHSLISDGFSDSLFFLSYLSMLLLADSEIQDDIDAEFGIGSCEYLAEAITFYCKSHKSVVDDKLNQAILNIEKLGITNHKTISDEVQFEVQNMFQALSQFRILKKGQVLTLLSNLGKLYGNQQMINKYDEGRRQGICWFIGRSIEVFCEKQRHEEVKV